MFRLRYKNTEDARARIRRARAIHKRHKCRTRECGRAVSFHVITRKKIVSAIRC